MTINIDSKQIDTETGFYVRLSTVLCAVLAFNFTICIQINVYKTSESDAKPSAQTVINRACALIKT